MPRLPIPGKDQGKWGDILNDYLSQAHKPDGQLKPSSVPTTALQSGSITENKLAQSLKDKLDQTQGATGASGASGTPGPQGATGASGTPGATGPAGPAGTPGSQGATGTPGTPGQDGQDGTNGATGATGPQGPQGDPGPASTVGATGATGSQGQPGATGAGATGATGPAGTDGQDGADGTNGTDGQDGSTGATGPQGATGPAGPQGEPGPASTVGATGSTGPKGDDGNDGAVGAAGATGATGPAGTQGATGANGTPGTQGATGAQGTAGAVGATGPKGDPGDPGASTIGDVAGLQAALDGKVAITATLGTTPAAPQLHRNLTYTVATNDPNIQEIAINGIAKYWHNEWGAIRGTSPYNWGDSLARAIRSTGDGISDGTGSAGSGRAFELVDRRIVSPPNITTSEHLTPSNILWGVRWKDGRMVQGGNMVGSVYVLNADQDSSDIPASLPSGTLIVRKRAA